MPSAIALKADIRTGLCQSQSPFPGNRTLKTETKAPNLAPKSPAIFVETIPDPKRRPLRGLSAKFLRKSQLQQDCVAADAVAFERVSASQFPANREKNREFRRIRALEVIFIADTRAISKACSEIPYATEQGIILTEQGILTKEQGISTANTGIVSG